MFGHLNSHLPQFDTNGFAEHQFNHSPSMPPIHLRQPSPGETSINGDRHLDVPQTYEQLIAANASLKTRVSELEVINELFRGRVTQLEQDEANARQGQDMLRSSENNLQQALEESRRRENQLKRRLDDLEREVGEMRETAGPRAKKIRVSDMVDDSEPSTPQSSI
jgi:GATA-binding protein, other eukaryote